MTINQLKKELKLSNKKLSNKEIAKFFDLKPTSYANSTAKKRYEQALCRFYEYIKEQRM